MLQGNTNFLGLQKLSNSNFSTKAEVINSQICDAVCLKVACYLLVSSQSPPTRSGVAHVCLGVGPDHSLTSPSVNNNTSK